MNKKFKNIPLPNGIIIKDYTIIKRISSGGFSFVYLGVNNNTNEIVAIKEYMPNSITVRNKGYEVYITNGKDKIKFDLNKEQFFNEMSIISQIKHHNIIHIMDYFEMNNTAYIVTPYEYGMPLEMYIKNLKKQKKIILEKDMIKIVLGILEAVQEIHNNNILHLDLKPSNIWIRPNNEILMLDFGAALEKQKVRTKQYIFTIGFAAIEQYKEYYKPLDIGVWTDYYGIGATLYNLLTFESPTNSIELKSNQKKLDIYNKANGLYHYKILEMVNKLCDVEVEERKKIILNEMIKEIKHIIPFNYKEKEIEQIILS